MNTQRKLPKRLTRKEAINNNCKDCIYDSAGAGTWRQQVGACEVTECALYEWRPMPVRASVLLSNAAIPSG